VLIRKHYRPPHLPAREPAGDPKQALAADIAEGRLTADELLRRYCSLVYAQTGSFEATARRLNIDRRTVRAKINPQVPR
jgi:hypothetical protein